MSKNVGTMMLAVLSLTCATVAASPACDELKYKAAAAQSSADGYYAAMSYACTYSDSWTCASAMDQWSSAQAEADQLGAEAAAC